MFSPERRGWGGRRLIPRPGTAAKGGGEKGLRRPCGNLQQGVTWCASTRSSAIAGALFRGGDSLVVEGGIDFGDGGITTFVGNSQGSGRRVLSGGGAPASTKSALG